MDIKQKFNASSNTGVSIIYLDRRFDGTPVAYIYIYMYDFLMGR